MLVSEVMTTDVVIVRPETALADAIDLMVEKRISGLAVVDGIGAPIGVLTESDLLRRVELGTDVDHEGLLDYLVTASDYTRSHGRRVRDVMTLAPATISDTASISAAVKVMREHNIRRVFVIRDGVLAGVVTRADLVRAVGQLLRAEAGQEARDKALEASIREELAAQDWLREKVVVEAHDGIVEVSGAVLDAQHRDAVRVLCENMSGVVDVRLHLAPAAGSVHVR